MQQVNADCKCSERELLTLAGLKVLQKYYAADKASWVLIARKARNYLAKENNEMNIDTALSGLMVTLELK